MMQINRVNKDISIMKILLIVLCFFSTLLTTTAQDSIPVEIIDKLKTNYKDFIIVKDNIYAITKGDSLVSWNYNSDSYKILKKNTNTITKNNNDELIITTTDNALLVRKDKWLKLFSFKGEALKVFIDKKNEPIIISSKGILYKNINYHPQKPCGIYKAKKRGDSIDVFFRNPDVSFLDSKDRIWLTYDNGEWGEEIWFFDLEKKTLFEEEHLSLEVDYNEFKNWEKYQTDLINAFPKKIKLTKNDTLYKFPAQLPIYYGVKGIAENENGNILISQSLNHFGVDGSIHSYYESEYKGFYEHQTIEVLDYENEIEDDYGNVHKYTKSFLTEYVGTITYNKFDKSFYYFSNKGFFKIIENNSSYSKELLFNPSLIWKGGLRHSVGYQMAVKKFEFIDAERFVFLTNLNGIGYYDGKQIKYYK